MAYLTAKEAADRMRVTTRTIRRYRAAGELRCVRFGGRVLYTVQELDRFARKDQ